MGSITPKSPVEPPLELREDESLSPDLDPLPPRARAMHAGITSLIQSVRRRFG